MPLIKLRQFGLILFNSYYIIFSKDLTSRKQEEYLSLVMVVNVFASQVNVL